MRHIRVADSVIVVAKGDITADASDALVCPTSEHLVYTGEVARAVSYSAGREVIQENERWLRKNGKLDLGCISVTRPGNLPCKHLIHVASPGYEGNKSGEEKLMRTALRNVLRKADELGAASVVIPNLVEGYPPNEAARVYFEVSLEYLTSHRSNISHIRFLNFDSPTVDGFVAEFDRRFPASVGIQRYFSGEIKPKASPTEQPSNQHVCCILL